MAGSPLLADLQRCRQAPNSCSFFFPPDFLGFQGHFPGLPILPAVVQLRLARLLIEESLGHPVTLLKVKNAKFLEKISANQTVNVLCQPKEGDIWNVTISVEGRPAATFSLTVSQA